MGDDNDNKAIRKIAKRVGIGVLAVWALTYLLFLFGDSEARGQFGDMFGAVNALFSGLAFAGLIITLILQKQELGYQRDELEQTREELKNQRKEFEMQNKTLKRQQFESALYNMLQLQQQIVNDLSYDSKVETYNIGWGTEDGGLVIGGRDLFRFSFIQLPHYYSGDDGETKSTEGMRGVLEKKGLSGYSRSNTPTYYDHYFQHLLRILSQIDENQDLSFDEKYNYISEVRSTLSRYELVWIYYSIMANKEFSDFKRIFEEYALLKNLNEAFLALSSENVQIVRKKGKAYFKQADFSMTDYEFFLTDVQGDPTKFYVGAFYDKEDISVGLKYARGCKKVIETV